MRDLDELLTDEPSRAAADHVHPPALSELRARGVRRRRTRRTAYAAGVAVVVASVALGAAVLPGDDSRPDPAPAPRNVGMIELADREYSYADFENLVVVDLAATRERLGLPADAVPGLDGSAASEELLKATFAIPHLGWVDPGVLGEAIDAGQITAAANTMHNGTGALTLLSTGQDFDSIADRLEESDYVRKGNLLTYVGDRSSLSALRNYAYMAGANGLLAMSSDRQDGARRVQQAVGAVPPARTPEGDLIARIQAATHAQQVTLLEQGIEPADRECVQTFVLADSFGGGDDEVVLVSDDPTAVGFDGLDGYGTPVTGAEWIRIRISAEGLRQPLEWSCG